MKFTVANESISRALKNTLRRADKIRSKRFDAEVAPLKQKLNKAKFDSPTYKKIRKKIEKLKRDYGYSLRY